VQNQPTIAQESPHYNLIPYLVVKLFVKYSIRCDHGT